MYFLPCYYILKACAEDKENTEVLDEINEPSSALDITKETDCTECKIPMVVFSASGQEGDAATEQKDDECSEDCESFNPADLMSFAWQIARGMVRKKGTSLCIEACNSRFKPVQTSLPALTLNGYNIK